MLHDSKVIFSIQGLFTKCCHIVNWFPLDPLFAIGIISPVSSRPKPTHQEWYCVKGSEGDLAQPVFDTCGD